MLNSQFLTYAIGIWVERGGFKTIFVYLFFVLRTYEAKKIFFKLLTDIEQFLDFENFRIRILVKKWFLCFFTYFFIYDLTKGKKNILDLENFDFFFSTRMTCVQPHVVENQWT